MSVARVFVVAALCLAPVLAQAQPNVQPARLPEVGVLSLHHAQHENAANIGGNAFRRGMQALGYSEGRSINIDVRHADGDRARSSGPGSGVRCDASRRDRCLRHGRDTSGTDRHFQGANCHGGCE